MINDRSPSIGTAVLLSVAIVKIEERKGDRGGCEGWGVGGCGGLEMKGIGPSADVIERRAYFLTCCPDIDN